MTFECMGERLEGRQAINRGTQVRRKACKERELHTRQGQLHLVHASNLKLLDSQDRGSHSLPVSSSSTTALAHWT